MTPTGPGGRPLGPTTRPGPARPPLPRMDSRIRARRIAVSREEGRRRLRVLVGAVAAAAVAAGCVGVTRSPLLDVDRVEVVGATRTPHGAVVAAGRLAGGPLMVSVGTGAVARRVEALPWVLDARATRRWPGTVRIEVTERRPVAVVPVRGGSRWALVDGRGRVLAVQAARPAGLVALGGLPAPGAPGSRLDPGASVLLAVVAALPADVASRVVDAALAPSGVELALTGPGGVVRLGGTDELPAKLRAMRAVLATVPLDDLAVLDVRVPASPVLTRR